MKHLLAGAIALSLAAGSLVWAQPPMYNGPLDQQRWQTMLDRFDASPEQREQMQGLMQSMNQQREALMGKHGIDPQAYQALHQEMRQLQSSNREGMHAIFTPEQLERMPQGQRGRRGMRPAQFMDGPCNQPITQ